MRILGWKEFDPRNCERGYGDQNTGGDREIGGEDGCRKVGEGCEGHLAAAAATPPSAGLVPLIWL